MAEYEAPTPADNSGGQDRIGARRRVRHSGTRVGSHVPSIFSIDVRHLDWHDDGSCRYVDPELFFPEGPPDGRAIAICAACPVKEKCFDDAMADPRRIGIWGGTTNADRDRIRGVGRAVTAAEYRAIKRAERDAQLAGQPQEQAG